MGKADRMAKPRVKTRDGLHPLLWGVATSLWHFFSVIEHTSLLLWTAWCLPTALPAPSQNSHVLALSPSVMVFGDGPATGGNHG